MSLLAAVALLTSCMDTMDDKADIDAAYNNPSQVTSTGVTLVSAEVKSYKRIDMQGSITNLDNVIEMGFLVGTSPDMSGAISIDATDYSEIIVNPSERGWYEEVATPKEVVENPDDDTDYSYVLSEDTEFDPSKNYFYDAGNTPVSPYKEGWYVEDGKTTYKLSTDTEIDPETDYYMQSFPEAFALSANTLQGGTTYYVCAYALTPSGIATSEVMQLTTPETPIFDISGYYFVNEYILDEDDMETWNYNGLYWLYIDADPDDPTALIMYNLFGLCDIFGGFEGVDAIYDPDEQMVYIASGSATGYTYGAYGNIMLRGVNASISAYTPYIEFEFTPKGGFLDSSICFMGVSAGRLSDYTYFEMEHMTDADVEEIFGSAKPRTYAPFVRSPKSFTLK